MNNIDKIYTNNALIFSEKYFDYLYSVLKNIDKNSISSFINTLLDARERNSSIFFIGNGGSAATSSHFANDLAIGVNCDEPFKAISLCDNNAIITALANDFGYEEIFSKQLQVLCKSGDVLVGISASGNSKNIINAFKLASSLGVKTVAITAFDGGEMRLIADESIHVPTGIKEYGPAEDAHMILDHLISGFLNRYLKSRQ